MTRPRGAARVSFVARRGETIALIGRTGAGKTTIANLLLRFYDVTGGCLRLEGRDVREIARDRLRSQIALIPQESFIFSGTIADNIAYSRPAATRQEIEAAARSLGAHRFIEELAQGYDTLVGDGGCALSQGQRQLIAFARALLSEAPILILDEATSNVDLNTEAHILRALTTVLAERTTLIITHRLGMIRATPTWCSSSTAVASSSAARTNAARAIRPLRVDNLPLILYCDAARHHLHRTRLRRSIVTPACSFLTRRYMCHSAQTAPRPSVTCAGSRRTSLHLSTRPKPPAVASCHLLGLLSTFTGSGHPVHPVRHSNVLIADNYEDTRYLLWCWPEALAYLSGLNS